MATRYDPVREFDRLTSQLFGSGRVPGMPMDLYRDGDHYTMAIDLPGVDPATIEISVEDRVLTVRANRPDSAPTGAQWLTRERAQGTFARQLSLGQGLATDKISASYDDGVLTLTIPVAEESKPRRIEVSRNTGGPTVIESSSEA